MAYIHKLTNIGIGWQHETATPKEGEIPDNAGGQALVLVPVNSPPAFSSGYQLAVDNKFTGAPYLMTGTGLDMPTTSYDPFNPSVTGIAHNFNLDILKRLFVATKQGFGTDLGAGASGNCYQIDCPTTGQSVLYNAVAADAIYSLVYVEDRGTGATGRWMGMCLPESFTLDFPADGSPVRMSYDLAAGWAASGATTSGLNITPTTTLYHADLGPGALTMYYGGSYQAHSGAGLSLTFTMDVEREHNGYRNPQYLTTHKWKVTGRVGDIDHESAIFNDWQAGTTRQISVDYLWNATPANNDPENWKINLPACRVTNNPQLEGEGRLYTAVEFEAVENLSDPLWEFYYNDTLTVWP